MRDARDNPHSTSTCRTCGGAIILPRRAKGEAKGTTPNHEGVWLHLIWPGEIHVAVPVAS